MDKVIKTQSQISQERLQYDLIVLEKGGLLQWYRLALKAAERLSGEVYFSLSMNEQDQVIILEELGLLVPRKKSSDGRLQTCVGALAEQPQMELFT